MESSHPKCDEEGIWSLIGIEVGNKGAVRCTGECVIEEPDAVVPHVRICAGSAR